MAILCDEARPHVVRGGWGCLPVPGLTPWVRLFRPSEPHASTARSGLEDPSFACPGEGDAMMCHSLLRAFQKNPRQIENAYLPWLPPDQVSPGNP
jgi:hypothetical protein